jgi:hypothetical protein
MPESTKPPSKGQTEPGRPARRPGSTRLTKSATSAGAIRKKALSKKIIDLRLEGLTVRAIDDRLRRAGFKTSKSEVQRILAAELASLGASQETKEQARALALDRLDTWTHSLFKRTKKGDEKAIATALRVEERRAKLIGTDAPEEQRIKLTILGQINWVFDVIERELGKDAAQRVIRRIGEEGGPPADGGGGPVG